ncbi:hypothetical protein Cni_G06030 [Canna indica]|uniref:Alpha-carbonic anhydrase domain-containing protein n=1 Tax=Canna indica TaxID=4628 RepID=A0AAQ3JYF4_9LILI|nr:hypothetical protein Cni_G06030 [Canna indica]
MAPMKGIFFMGISALLVACACANDAITYGYSGENGPDKWGSLSSDFRMCSQGKSQSPIDIAKNHTVYKPDLKNVDRDYISMKATLVNTGPHIQLRFDKGAGNVTIDGKNYTLQEVHWHSPSEHTIEGERFPMEFHLFHRSSSGELAIVAILYQYGDSNDAFLLQIQDELIKLGKEKCAADQEAQIPAGTVQTRALKRRTRKYYRYVGSLTDPPCTENVIWIILGKVREMSKEQAQLLKAPLDAAYQSNSRPLQPLNGRTVQLYDEMHDNDKSGDNKSKSIK